MSSDRRLIFSAYIYTFMEIKRKRILISCDSPRSLLAFRGKLIERLIEKHEVHVFTPKIGDLAISGQLATMGVQVHENNLNPSNVSIWSDLKYLKQLYRLIKALRPDVFFPYTFKPVIYGTIVARFCKVGYITPMLTGLGNNFSKLEKKLTFVQRITQILLKYSMRAHKNLCIIFQNRDDFETLLTARVLSLKNRVQVVNGSGVDLSYYKYFAPDLKAVSFLMIARLINAKGIREYYEAARVLKQRFPHLNFRLIGPYDDNIDAIDKDFYMKIRTDGVLEYLGLINDVRPHIRNTSVVVLPSYYGEGIPRCILEGMAMGRAIITSNSVGCKETVNPSVSEINGFLVPAMNIDALIRKMQHYIEHPTDIIRYGINGRKYAEEKFDVDKVNRNMVQILEGSHGLP
jgi:glycosyltransferase involved in cell wall biosynthesis